MPDTVKTLNARTLGKGKHLLVLHGLYGSSDNWVSIGRKLSDYFTVHLIDLRNHGNSFHHEEHNYNCMCHDVLNYLQTHNIKQCSLVGHSMGGKVAMLFSITYPQMVEKLIVLDIAPKNYTNHISKHLLLIKTMQSIEVDKIKNRSKIADIAIKTLKEEKLVHLLLKNIYRNKAGTFSWKLNLSALQNNILNISGGTENWQKKPVSIPTLFLKGEKSEYLNNEDCFFMQLFFSSFEVNTVLGAGHWLHAEKPKEIINKILDFSLT